MKPKISVYIATSLDGFIARTNGDLDWLGSGDDRAGEDYGYHKFMDSVDVLVMGRHTFEQVMTFGEWPYGSKRVVVLSTNIPEIPDSLSEVVTTLSMAPAELVEHLSKQGATHLYVDGGITIQRFFAANLVDELIITRIPILIGSGIPLFGSQEADIHLTHIVTHQFESGFVQSRYQITKNA